MIVILVGDVDCMCDVFSRTHLIWGSKGFWRKLHYCMPHIIRKPRRITSKGDIKSNGRICYQKSTSSAAEDFVDGPLDDSGISFNDQTDIPCSCKDTVGMDRKVLHLFEILHSIDTRWNIDALPCNALECNRNSDHESTENFDSDSSNKPLIPFPFQSQPTSFDSDAPPCNALECIGNSDHESTDINDEISDSDSSKKPLIPSQYGTHDHVLSRCQIIHNDNSNKVASSEFSEDDPDKLKRVAFRIETTMTILETFYHYPVTNSVNPTAASRPGHCGVPEPAPNSDGVGTAQRTGHEHNS